MAEEVKDEIVEPTPVEQVSDETPVAAEPVEAPAADAVPAEVEVPVDENPVEAPAEATSAPVEPLPQLEQLKPESIKPKVPRIPLPSSLQEIVGALLFASESPLTAAELRTCVRGVAPEEGDDAEVMSVYQSCTSREIDQALRGLEKELERSGCGFRLVCSGGTYRLQTAPTCGRYVRALLKLDRPSRLSRASLETLAIIAYRQPITKAEIEQIRGVAVDTIVKSLVELQLVRLVGRSELPGHPFLYGTSPLFLEHFGLASLSELNAIDPTLQRSNPRERAKLFVKEKKPEDKKETAEGASAEEAQPAVEQENQAPAAASDGVDGATEASTPSDGAEASTTSRRVSFRPDEEDELIDDTPDAFDDEDESLVDDDDESLVDDDDESLVDDDDESLLDDEDEEGEFDDEDGEEDEEGGDAAEGDDDE